MDVFDEKTRSRIMARIKSKNTKPEIAIRSALHRAGFRFRLHAKELPGRPDIVLPKYRTIILHNGCFWHGHKCKLGRLPTSNRKFWREKIRRNRKRDAENERKLEAMGWKVVRIWTCGFEAGLKKSLKLLRAKRTRQRSKDSSR